MSYGLCEACGADIIWALTLPGRNRMPVDPDRYRAEDTTANLIVSRDHLGSIIVRVAREGVEVLPGQWRAMPHFATCRARGVGRRRPDDIDELGTYFPPFVVHDLR
jgi:hypothetical protein